MFFTPNVYGLFIEPLPVGVPDLDYFITSERSNGIKLGDVAPVVCRECEQCVNLIRVQYFFRGSVASVNESIVGTRAARRGAKCAVVLPEGRDWRGGVVGENIQHTLGPFRYGIKTLVLVEDLRLLVREVFPDAQLGHARQHLVEHAVKGNLRVFVRGEGRLNF